MTFRKQIEKNDVAALRQAIEAGTDPNGLDETLLPWIVVALRADAYESLEALLQAGARPEGPVGDPLPPLAVAMRMGKLPAIELLLRFGADPNRQLSQGKTALHIATSCPRAEELIDLLIASGAKPDSLDDQGHTPLMKAAAEGRITVVERLLAGGAEPGYVSPGGETALSLAAAKGHKTLCDLLQEPSLTPSPPGESQPDGPPSMKIKGAPKVGGSLRIKGAHKGHPGTVPATPEPTSPVETSGPAKTGGPRSMRIKGAPREAAPPPAPEAPPAPQASPAPQAPPAPEAPPSPPPARRPIAPEPPQAQVPAPEPNLRGFQLAAGLFLMVVAAVAIYKFRPGAPASPSPTASPAVVTSITPRPTPTSSPIEVAGLWTGPKGSGGDTLNITIQTNQLPSPGSVAGVFGTGGEFGLNVTWSRKGGSDDLIEGRQSQGEPVLIGAVSVKKERMSGRVTVLKPRLADGKVTGVDSLQLDVSDFTRQAVPPPPRAEDPPSTPRSDPVSQCPVKLYPSARLIRASEREGLQLETDDAPEQVRKFYQQTYPELKVNRQSQDEVVAQVRGVTLTARRDPQTRRTSVTIAGGL